MFRTETDNRGNWFIVGTTYPVKDQIKAAGFRWNGDRKQWGCRVQAQAMCLCGELNAKFDNRPQAVKDAENAKVDRMAAALFGGR